MPGVVEVEHERPAISAEAAGAAAGEETPRRAKSRSPRIRVDALLRSAVPPESAVAVFIEVPPAGP